MENKSIIITMLVVLAVGLFAGGIYIYSRNRTPSSLIDQGSPDQVNTAGETTRIRIQPSPTVVQPTIPPLSETIKAIDDKMITVTGKSGDLLLPKTPDKVKVFKRSASGLVEGTYADLKVGQAVTFEIIPNKYGQIIIESR